MKNIVRKLTVLVFAIGIMSWAFFLLPKQNAYAYVTCGVCQQCTAYEPYGGCTACGPDPACTPVMCYSCIGTTCSGSLVTPPCNTSCGPNNCAVTASPTPPPDNNLCVTNGDQCVSGACTAGKTTSVGLSCGTGADAGDTCCEGICKQDGGTCLTYSTCASQGGTNIGVFECAEECCKLSSGGPTPAPTPPPHPCVVCSSGYTYDTVAKSCFKTDDTGATTADPGQTTADCGDKVLCYQGCGCSPCDKNYPYKTTTGRLPCGTTGDCNTAIGPVSADVTSIIKTILGVILSVSGGIAILLIIISAYRLMVSQGNPEGIQNAREQLTAAIVGLLFVIFSVTILWFIGYNVLGLTGFNP